ncbi:response regulator [Roseospira visakhapatnamensis]|uniref:CheY-like chemotaxis protein n=1 Tax=Roseospira visakhapatnamensis TaxID=390880 RepID=A0A7W6RCW3_9PROT|nr:response regulator [Roseospira visakhapatnamensis]MBB4266231.1 CheY-like chemotaxis protein [Roseospira visakhapatnamensis]
MAKLLVVEDNDMNWDMLSRWLRKRGFDLARAVNGEEAVVMAADEAPDLILMDMGLPIKDGYQATREIKANEATRALPVIALTANAMAEDEERAMSAGCDGYQSKPIDFPQLLRTMQPLLPGALPEKAQKFLDTH